MDNGSWVSFSKILLDKDFLVFSCSANGKFQKIVDFLRELAADFLNFDPDSEEVTMSAESNMEVSRKVQGHLKWPHFGGQRSCYAQKYTQNSLEKYKLDLWVINYDDLWLNTSLLNGIIWL